MTGPNLTNNLLGVLIRFRSEKVAVIADLQQMFYSFYVRSDHRDYLRFVWHENNDLTKELVDFRMKVHVFGLQKTADIAGEMSGMDVKEYIFVTSMLMTHCPHTVRVKKRLVCSKELSKLYFASGKLLLHEAMTEQLDWDHPLPDEFRAKFKTWKNSLKLLENVQIPRTCGGDLSDIYHRVLLLKGLKASFINLIDEVPSSFPLVTPDEDCEVRTLKTTVGKEVPFGIHRFEHFSTWISLIRAVTTLKTM
ncbi:unnamed protein product [Mytilus coruscus]|uniref:Uncharacterized protein n=1 Tax=Mytilus coruscus TaxID=42192 RepID=A0A6J8AWB8_MYTCO|nr:unnamed protein product [Mytilus coruscus]